MASALAVARPAALVPRGGSESITGNLPMLPAVPSTRFVSGVFLFNFLQGSQSISTFSCTSFYIVVSLQTSH
jgi:hypothetical protein